jgi:hypothetical protein
VFGEKMVLTDLKGVGTLLQSQGYALVGLGQVVRSAGVFVDQLDGKYAIAGLRGGEVPAVGLEPEKGNHSFLLTASSGVGSVGCDVLLSYGLVSRLDETYLDIIKGKVSRLKLINGKPSSLTKLNAVNALLTSLGPHSTSSEENEIMGALEGFGVKMETFEGNSEAKYLGAVLYLNEGVNDILQVASRPGRKLKTRGVQFKEILAALEGK